jgi:Alpha-tubulin suppressor and related RCC1 domain-containing proteins
MTILKCKMCGGDIEAFPDAQFGTCDSCGSTMTLPRIDSEQKANAFNRANRFRLSNDFDKALNAYEQILLKDEDDAETHWGIVLSRYGIEYVEDPVTHSRIPTIRRVQPSSILSDPNYLAALEYAPDAYSRSLYEQEARGVAEIQKRLLAMLANEDPYDVFICYKERTDGGSRTKDSVIAQEIYQQLEKQGHRTFFARIALEDKLGQEYEPYIFSALNSARVMLVIGTQPQYFSAPWVKNEWSRYLPLVRKDGSKLLIPCYQGMEAYELPAELGHFQSQDMSKIGFVQDLLRGVQKVLSAKPAEVNANEGNSGNAIYSEAMALNRRGRLFLEDGDFEKAEEYFERALDLSPETPKIYLNKLLAKHKTRTDKELFYHYLETIRRAAMSGSYVLKIPVYIDLDKEEHAKLHALRNHPLKKNNDFTRSDVHGYFLDRKKTLENIREHMDTDSSLSPLSDSLYQKAIQLSNEEGRQKYYFYANQLVQHVDKLISKVDESAEKERFEALEKRNAHRLRLEIAEVEEKIAAREEEVRKQKKKAKDAILRRRLKKVGIAATLVLIIFINKVVIPEIKESKRVAQEKAEQYQQAQLLLEERKYAEARKAFLELGTYKSSENYIDNINEFAYIEAQNLLANKEHTKAWALFVAFGSYMDSAEQAARLVSAARQELSNTIAASSTHTVALKNDGTVVAAGSNSSGQCDVGSWKDIVAVAVGAGYTLALKSDGTIISTGDNRDGQCNVTDWTDVIVISSGGYHTIALRADGRLYAVGRNYSEQCYIGIWESVAQVSAGGGHSVGLTPTGTVVAVGDDGKRQLWTSQWQDIISVSAGAAHTIGLQKDGKVVATGDNSQEQCNVSRWDDIIAISAAENHTIGLKADGTVVAIGNNRYGQCDVSEWRNIVAISAGNQITVGLRADGTMVATGRNNHGQCDVEDWTNIMVNKRID